MARVLHLLTGTDTAIAPTVIQRDLEAGDEVVVALLADDAAAPSLPEGVAGYRVPSDWSYEELLERIFAADRVTTW